MLKLGMKLWNFSTYVISKEELVNFLSMSLDGMRSQLSIITGR